MCVGLTTFQQRSVKICGSNLNVILHVHTQPPSNGVLNNDSISAAKIQPLWIFRDRSIKVNTSTFNLI